MSRNKARHQSADAKQRTENVMLRGGGSNISPQDRGSWQSSAPTTSNPYYYANFYERWREYVRWYETDWASRKIVNIPVDDAFRIPFRITGLDPQDTDVLMLEWDRLGGERQFRRALKQMRLLGGCAIYIGVADVATTGAKAQLDAPLVPINVELLDGNKDAVRCLNVVDTNRIYRGDINSDPLNETYDKVQEYKIDGRPVSVSRLIVFDGDPLFNRQNMNLFQAYRVNPAGFGESVLAPLYDTLVRVTGTQEGAYHLVNMASVLLMAIKDFKTLAATKPGEEAIGKLASIINQINVYRGALIDGNGVEISQHSASFGSVPELLMSFLQILSAGSDIPATRFLGQAPGGLNATGESDLENYYNVIDSWQRQMIRPRMMKVFEIIGVAKFGGARWAKMRQKFDIDYPPLWNLKETDQAQLAEQWVEAMKTLKDMGLIDAANIQKELKARNVFVSDVELKEALTPKPVLDGGNPLNPTPPQGTPEGKTVAQVPTPIINAALSGGRAESEGRKPENFDPAALAEGTAHEMEHTADESAARQIAMDHLAEDPEYYAKLKRMERKG